mgnify:CR=1 FL=1
MGRVLSGLLAVLLMGSVAASADDGGKLSFGLRQLVARQDHGRRTAGAQEQKVCVFVKFRVSEADSLLALYHAEKVTQIGNVYIVNIPLSQVSALAADDKVERVEAQFGGRLMNDVTPQWVNSGAVYAGTGLPEGYDGRGVLVGIVDGGFDLTHPTFYATDGVTCRIKGLVDDYATDDETIGVPTPLGREYATEADILAKRYTADVGMEHGTHCLGIAAGSGLGTDYRGVAYGADLYAVSSKVAIESAYSSGSDVARMKRIFDYAAEHHQPCVITYSIGFNDLPDDARLYAEAMEGLTGEGRIVVTSAGNSNLAPMYVEKQAGQETAGTMLSLNRDEAKGIAYLRSVDPFRLKCILLRTKGDGYELGDSVTFDTNQLPADSVVLKSHHILLEKQGTFYTLTDRTESLSGADAYLMLAIEGKDAYVEMSADQMCAFCDIQLERRFSCAEKSHNIGLPATLPCMIPVGALNGRASFTNVHGEVVPGFGASTELGTIASFSSVGPTFDKRIKPDVVAPGVNVISSGNSYYAYDHSYVQVATTSFNGREYPWIVMSGTSMSTPCVAGIVALWLQADPTLTPEEVKDILKVTCKPIAGVTEYPNNTYGYGLIDAYAGIKEVLKRATGINTVQSAASRAQDCYYDLQGRRVAHPTRGIYVYRGKKIVW